MEANVENQIRRRTNARGRGAIVFPEEFYRHFKPGNVTVAFSALQRKGHLKRLAQGIYLFPKMDPELGILLPGIDQIAAAIAKRDKARIVPTGILALNQLGLSTQVPLKAVYLTDGSPRKIMLGNRSITFKKKSPKALAMKGKISSLVVMALQELGKEGITESMKVKLSEVLQNENPKTIWHDAHLAPAWVAQIVINLVANPNHATPKTTARKKI